jgi:hypothetical protein
MPYLTMFDVVEHLITSSFGGPQDAEQRDIRTAVHRAYDELTQIRDWSYYSIHSRIVTSPSYTAGTVGITSGTVTLTNGSFATAGITAANAKYWTLKAGDRTYPISAYGGATSLTVDSSFDDIDVTAGATYAVYRTSYPLPSDFRNMDEPSDEYNWWAGLYITPDEAMKLERVSNSSGEPYHWTIIKDPVSSGWAIKLIGYPTAQETIDFTYRRTARQIRYSGHEASARAGTISRSSATVTGTSTQFTSAMVGSVLRVGDTTNSPGPLTSITPYVSESKIASYASATSVTTEDSGTIASSTKYLVTDPIDLPAHLHNAMYSASEYWLARIRNQAADKAFGLYQRDLRLAMEMDQLAPLSGRSEQIWHDGGWKSPLKPDQGI